MHQPMLPRDDDTQHMTFEGKSVVLLHSESGTYREWEVTIARERYCIVDEDGTWTLLRYDPVTRQWLERSQSVDTFLILYRLILAA
jgi:hypothetical protein